MENNYTKAYKEVLEVLKYVDKIDVDKIPKEMLEMFESNQDEKYEFKYDESKKFEEQNLLQETRVIFAIIFKDYWANNQQREKIITKQRYDIQKSEEEKRNKYNPDKIFKEKQNIVEDKTINRVAMIEYKESILKRITNKIKSILNCIIYDCNRKK